jgi:hypothetical protein
MPSRQTLVYALGALLVAAFLFAVLWPESIDLLLGGRPAPVPVEETTP